MSYAGMFETELGVSSRNLEVAVRRCFASRFDSRVFFYNTTRSDDDDDRGSDGDLDTSAGGFAVVVMEMVDSITAGVAFSGKSLIYCVYLVCNRLARCILTYNLCSPFIQRILSTRIEMNV